MDVKVKEYWYVVLVCFGIIDLMTSIRLKFVFVTSTLYLIPKSFIYRIIEINSLQCV